MLKDKLTLLIHTCDKYSDLWDAHIKLLNTFWSDRSINTLLVTDKESTKNYEGVKIVSTGNDLELPERTAMALNSINTEYILITLDDYFLIKKISTDKIAYLVDIMEKENLDYIRLFSIPRAKKRMKNYKSLYEIELKGNYKVNLYPGIWRKSFVEKTIKKSMNAWQYEVSLTKIAKDNGAVCIMSKGKEFEILDVVRKGKLLNRANRYLKKHNLYNGPREVISMGQELKLNIMFYGKEIIPDVIFRWIKRILIKRGHQFYSDVE